MAVGASGATTPTLYLSEIPFVSKPGSSRPTSDLAADSRRVSFGNIQQPDASSGSEDYFSCGGQANQALAPGRQASNETESAPTCDAAIPALIRDDDAAVRSRAQTIVPTRPSVAATKTRARSSSLPRKPVPYEQYLVEALQYEPRQNSLKGPAGVSPAQFETTIALARQRPPHRSGRKFKAWLAAAKKSLWTPVGILASIYGLLIFAWGTALFVIIMGWTKLPMMPAFQWVEICSQVMTALFALTGIGFLPWRTRDTYHFIVMADYAHLSRVRERRQHRQGILGKKQTDSMTDVPFTNAFERAVLQKQESTVVMLLDERQRHRLRHSTKALMNSVVWFKPFASLSHRASSLYYVGIIILLNDLNSAFQAVLCGFMWGLPPIKRPFLAVGISVAGAVITALSAGILMWIGSARSRHPADANRKVFENWKKEERVLDAEDRA